MSWYSRLQDLRRAAEPPAAGLLAEHRERLEQRRRGRTPRRRDAQRHEQLGRRPAGRLRKSPDPRLQRLALPVEQRIDLLLDELLQQLLGLARRASLRDDRGKRVLVVRHVAGEEELRVLEKALERVDPLLDERHHLEEVLVGKRAL